MRKFVLIAILGAVAAGCGIAYSVNPAVMLVTDVETLSLTELHRNIRLKLEPAGFEDLGRDDETIALLRRFSETKEIDTALVSAFQHEHTYLNDRDNLRVVVTDFTDADWSWPTHAYERPAGPFFEVRVYEERPGGFSVSGHQFLVEFRNHLSSLGSPVTLVIAPPVTDDAEFWRVTIANFASGAFNWLVAFCVPAAVFGAVLYVVLKPIPIRIVAKRGIFVVINTWLATPLPFPVASILVILLPNLVAFPWTDLDYYRKVQGIAIVSFPIAMTLCTLISLRMFRGASDQ